MPFDRVIPLHAQVRSGQAKVNQSPFKLILQLLNSNSPGIRVNAPCPRFEFCFARIGGILHPYAALFNGLREALDKMDLISLSLNARKPRLADKFAN